MRRAVLALLVLGCSGPSPVLLVDVETDLPVGRDEIDAFRVEVIDGPGRGSFVESEPVLGADYRRPTRVAELRDLAAGTIVLRVAALRGATVAVERPVELRLEEGRAQLVTVALPSTCEDVACPRDSDAPSDQACIGDGRCVPASCTPETPEDCPVDRDVVCRVDEDCPSAICSLGVCDLGVCRLRVAPGCAPDAGVVPADAGPDDGGPPDGGPPTPPSWSETWARRATSGRVDPLDMVVDDAGVLYVGGGLGASGATLEDGTVLDGDAFIASYAADGARRWEQVFRSSSTLIIHGVAIHGDAVWAGGRYSGNDARAGVSLPPVGSIGELSGLLMRYRPSDGGYLGGTTFGLDSETWDVAVDALGNAFHVGRTDEDSALAGATQPPTSQAVYLASDATSPRFRRAYPGEAADRFAGGRSVAVGGDRVAVGGVLGAGSYDFGAGPQSAVARDGFVGVWTRAGDPEWVRVLGDTGEDVVSGVVVDAEDTVWAVGSTTVGADFGDGPVSSRGVFVARWGAADGTLLMARTFDAEFSFAGRITIDRDGRGWIAARVTNARLDGEDLADGLVAVAFSPDGEVAAVHSWPSTTSSLRPSIAARADGAIYVGGATSDGTFLRRLDRVE